VLAIAVFAGATILPLTAEVLERAQIGPAYAQSEVFITEQAASELVRGRNPYAAQFMTGPLVRRPLAVQIHFPYLPLMMVFGLPKVLDAATPWTDARIAFGIVALALIIVALALWKRSGNQALRVFQIMLVLPTGALILVAGGDDLPVLGLMLLAVILLELGRPAMAGMTSGLAGLIKLTAWPLIVFLAVAASRQGSIKRDRWACLCVSAAILLVAVPFIWWNASAFADDAVLFPLGLSRLPSLAHMPTLGSIVTHTFVPRRSGERQARDLLVVGLMSIPAILALACFKADRCSNAASAARCAGLVLGLAFLMAPQGRPGYAIYPINLLFWSKLLASPPAGTDSPSFGAESERSPAEAGSMSRPSRLIDSLRMSDSSYWPLSQRSQERR
jgi:hypothetical protein